MLPPSMYRQLGPFCVGHRFVLCPPLNLEGFIRRFTVSDQHTVLSGLLPAADDPERLDIIVNTRGSFLVRPLGTTLSTAISFGGVLSGSPNIRLRSKLLATERTTLPTQTSLRWRTVASIL